MAAIKYWVWLSALRMRPVAKIKLLDHFGYDPERLYYADARELTAVEGLTAADIESMGIRELETAMEILVRCDEQRLQIITLQDAAYPWRLKNIYDPPVVLYGRGRLPMIDEEAAIAIVGTREPTPYGIRMARKFGEGLTECGGLLISGLTRGIERASVQAALSAGGRVVGVLGTSMDEARGGLYEDVVVNGALLTEYPPGQKTYKSAFRERNRITAGLSAGVLVVEAPARSGTLLFAEEALEQGKEIFVIPANADVSSCMGNHRLLKEGAHPVTEAWDVLVEYTDRYRGKLHRAPQKTMTYAEREQAELREKYPDFVQVRVPNPKKEIDKPESVAYIDLENDISDLSELQQKLVAVLRLGETAIDELIEATEADTSAVLSELTMLEIMGIVQQEPGKRFRLNQARG